MTRIDDLVLPKVVSVLATYGKTLTVEIPLDADYVPATGEVIRQAPTTHTVKATPPDPYSSRLADGSAIKIGDSRIYVAGSGLAFVPAEGQRWTIDGATWVTVRTNAIYSGESIALWEIQLRR